MARKTAIPRFFVFGGLRVETGGLALTGRAAQKKRLGALAVLAATYPAEMSREVLAALFWPESPPERSRRRLASTLYELRHALGDVVVEEAGSGLRFDPQVLPCDAVDFEEALARGDLESAADLYRGPFLDGVHLNGGAEVERWADAQRDRYARSYGSALEGLAERRAAARDVVGAAAAWRQLAAHEPYNSRIAVRLMHALEAAGDRAGAMLHAEEHTSRLRNELEVEPDPAVQELTERLRSESVNGGTFLADQATGAHSSTLEPDPRTEDAAARHLPAEAAPEEQGRRPTDAAGDGDHPSSSSHAAAPERPRARNGPRMPRLLGILATVVLAGALVYAADDARRPAPDLVTDRILVGEFHMSRGNAELRDLVDLATRRTQEALAKIEIGEFIFPDAGDAEARIRPHDLRAAVRLGREHGAATAVFGSIRFVGGEPSVQVRVVDVAERRIAHSIGPIHLDAADPQSGFERLRGGVAGALAFRLDPRFSSLPRSRRAPADFALYQALAGGAEHLANAGPALSHAGQPRKPIGDRIEPLSRAGVDADAAADAFRHAAALDSTFMLAHVLVLKALDRAWRHDELRDEVAHLAGRRGDMDAWERLILDYYTAVDARDLNGAYQAARSAAELVPGSLSAWLHGVSAARMLRLEEAADALERLGADDPWATTFFEYFPLLSNIYHFLGRYEDELRVSRQGRAVRQYNPLFLSELRARIAMGDIDGALAQFEAEIASRPPRPGHHLLLLWVAREAARHGHPAVGDQLRQRVLARVDALSREEQEAVVHRFTRAFALDDLGRYEDALPLVRRLVDDHEHLPPYLMYLGQFGGIAARLGRDADAESARERIWATIGDPEKIPMRRANPEALLALGRIAAAEGDRAQTVHLLQHARASQRGAEMLIERHAHDDPIFASALADDPALRVLVRTRQNGCE